MKIGVVEICYMLFALLNLTQANITSLCGRSDSYWDVQEDKQDNTFTCTGLSANDAVQWVMYLNSLSVPLGSCPPRPSNGSQPVCDQRAAPVFKPDRTSDDTSVMVVNDTAASDLHREVFSKGRLVCLVVVPGPPPTVGCRLDYIYAAENVSCTIQFQQDKWTVSGHCSVKKTRSAQNRYRCEWTQIKESSRESVFIANTSMTVVPSVGTNYVSGSCNFTSELPPEGRYTYRVTVVPGEVTVNTSVIGSNEIRRPAAKPYHNCPQYVVEGSDLSCTCFVTDPGSPPGVLQWNTTQSVQLSLSDIRPLNSGTYVCRLLWNDTFVQTVEYTLRLASPPSTPIIYPAVDTTGRLMYPFMEGTNGTLYCYSNQTGRPEATYTWPVPATGHVSGANLTFYQLTRDDNGRIVKCRANNLYTENRQPVDDSTLVLQVYYKPVVSFTSVLDTNDCTDAFSSSAYTRCVVAEGRRVHINCTADSSPPPASFQWMGKNKNIFSNTSELVITSVDKAIHDGDYICTVVTRHGNTDSRLPLTASVTFTVIVGRSPSVLDFILNSAENMTVNTENTRVDLKCVANGRPTPSVRLINASDPSQFINMSEPKSDVYDDNKTGEVKFSINRVKCEDSGVYRCEANNTLGQDTQSQRLLVYCGPRGKNNDDKVPTVTSTEGKGELSFTMTAYPTPAVKSITYLEGMVNPGRGDSSVKDNIIQVACSAGYLSPAVVTCNVSVTDMKRTDKGFYRIIFSNSLGEMAFIFYLEEDNQEGGTDSKTVAIAVLAAMLAVVLVVIVVAVVWVWRRGCSVPCTGKESQRLTHQSDIRSSTSEQQLTTERTKMSSTGKDRDVGPYDGLRLEDVGMRSPYEEIRQEQSAGEISQYKVLQSDRTHEVRLEEPSYSNQ